VHPRPGETSQASGQAAAPNTEPLPLLFLIADTGGGHRNAARAVGQALDRRYPGRFAPVLCDPLGGPGSGRLLRWVSGLYGPAIRLLPWLWGAAYHACDSRLAVALLRRTLLRLADRPATAAVLAHRPAAIVSFHPLTGMAAVAARDRGAAGVPVMTVVTDLARMHSAWDHANTDLIVAPPTAVRRRDQRRYQRRRGQDRGPRRRGRRDHPGSGARVAAGLPVTRDFWGGPLQGRERAILRRSLGLSETRFLVLLTGGGEGCGGIARRAAAILRRFPEVDLVAVCGRNRRLKRKLDRLAARVVVLPAPLGPSRQNSWPSWTAKLMSSTALRRAARYRLTR
jgi:1,2-diacylglycerol 3-beta-galactosyltransferase